MDGFWMGLMEDQFFFAWLFILALLSQSQKEGE